MAAAEIFEQTLGLALFRVAQVEVFEHRPLDQPRAILVFGQVGNEPRAFDSRLGLDKLGDRLRIAGMFFAEVEIDELAFFQASLQDLQIIGEAASTAFT